MVVVVVVCLENVIFIKIFQSAKLIIESVTSLPMTRSFRLSVGKSLSLLVGLSKFSKGAESYTSMVISDEHCCFLQCQSG